MKLHLPKQLFTALLAAFTLAAAPAALTLGSTAWGEDASHWNITQDHSGETQTIGNGETFYIGNGTSNAAGGGNSSTVFNSGKLTVGSGGTLFIHGFAGTDRDIDTTGKLKITSDIEVQGGGTLHLEDGSYYFSGNINITGGAENVSTIHSRWDKGFVFDHLKGTKTASLKLTGASSNTTFTLQGDGAYAGHIEVNNGNRNTRLVINSAGALSSTASIAITGSNTKLAINTEAITLSHLSAVAGNSLILAKDTGLMGSVTAVDASTVTISNTSASDATFSGTIGSGITLEVASGAYQNFGAVTNNGNMVLNGTVNIASAITGSGSVEVGGNLTLADYENLYNLSYIYEGGGTSGFRTGFTGSLTASGALTFADGATLNISNLGTGDSFSVGDNGSVTGTLVGSTTYDVNGNMTYAAATHGSATHVCVNSGTLTIGNTGNAAGTASGVPASQNFVLNGGSIKWAAQATTIAGIEVIDNSDFTIFDMRKVDDSQSIGNYLTLSSVDIADGKTLTINNNVSWKQWLNIAALTGEGTLAVNGPGSSDHGESNAAYHLITLSDFKGDISVTSREGTNANNPDRNKYHATVNTGESGVNMGTLTIAGFGQQNEVSTFTFNVQGDSSLQSIALTDAATVNVSENKGLTVSSVSSGTGTGTLTKTGSGSMTAGINALHGLLKIEGGSFNLSGLADSVDSNNAVYRTVEVGNGATLDIKGFAAYNNLTLKEGATLANSSSTDPGSDKRQLPLITLEGNAEVAATGTIRMIGHGYNATTLNLGEYTLTKTGAGEFNMLNTTVQGTGSIQINEGKVVAGVSNGKSQDLSALSLNIQSSGRFELNGSSQSIKSLTMTGGSLATASGHTLTVSGDSTFSSGASTVGGSIIFGGAMEIAEGATAAFNGAMTIAEGATATIGGGATISSTVSNNGTLVLNGTLNVTNSSNLTQVGEESTSYVGGSVEGNGYTTTTYQLVSGSGSISYGESFAVTLNGATTGVHGTSKGENTLTIDKAGSKFYVMTGEEIVSQNEMSFISAYHVAKGATLELSDAIANSNGYSTTITGDGKLHINIGSNNEGSHGNVLKSVSEFTGVVEIESTGTDGAGNTQLDAYVLKTGASFRLISGNHWSSGGQNISRAIELAGEGVDDFAFRHNGSLELSGKVTGTYLTAGRNYGANGVSDADNNLTLSGADSNIQHVTMKGGTLTVNAGMTFGTLFANEVVLTNSAKLGIGYTDDSGKVISGDSSINGSFTLNANTGLNITAGTMNVNGAVTNSGAITVSGGSVDFANTLGMGAGSSLSVSGGSATVSGALNVTGENVSLSQSDTGVLNLNGSVSIAQNAGLTLSGNVGIANTIVNDGTLVFNDRLDLLGDLLQYDQKTAGQTSYTRDGNQGFIHEEGAQYWLTRSSSDELAEGASVSFGANFETNDTGNHIVHYGESETFELKQDGKHYYFSTTSATGATFYVSSTGLEVSADEASRAAAFVLSDGSSMTLVEGAATNGGATITAEGNNTINLAAGSTLNAFTQEGSGTITLTGSGTYIAERSGAVYVTPASLQDSSNWTGTVQFTGNVSESAGFDNRFGNVNSTIEMKGASGWFAQDKTLSSTIKLTKDGAQNGFTVTAASPGWLLTIAGAVTGNGDFTISQSGTDAAPDYKFTGNISGWSGSFVLNESHDQTIDVEMTQVGDLFAAESGGIKVAEGSVGTLAVKLGSANEESVTNMRGSVINESADAALNLTVQGNTDFQKDVTVTRMTVNAGKTATMNATLKAGTVTNNGELKLGTAATVTGGTMGNVTAQSSGISSTATDGTKGTLANADVSIAQLAEGTSFSITDMALSNVKLSAAQGTTVALNNLSGSAELAGAGHFSISGGEAQYTLAMSPVQAQVAAAANEKGSALTLSYASSTAITLNNSEGSNPTLALSVDPTLDVNGVFGAYDVTLTLSNFGISSADLGESGDLTALSNAGITFTGWLGDALSNQTTATALAEAVEDAPAAPTAPTVSYTYTAGTGSNVGTLVITINGLNVPEPAAATLGLAALMMLCARRRRKA